MINTIKQALTTREIRRKLDGVCHLYYPSNLNDSGSRNRCFRI